MLGYPDEYIDDESTLDFRTSKIGGRPNWFQKEEEASPLETLKCKVCQARGCGRLVAQIYAPLEGKSLHRTLYVFTCSKQACQNNPDSWHCLKGQKSSAPTGSKSQGSSNGGWGGAPSAGSGWNDDADDWGSDEEENNKVTSGTSPVGKTLENSDDIAGSCQRMTIDDDNSDDDDSRTNGQEAANEAVAEIEVDSDLDGAVSSGQVETASVHQHDSLIPKLFSAEGSTCLSTTQQSTDLCFDPFYIAVDEEHQNSESSMTAHERKLLEDYKKSESGKEDCTSGGSGGGGSTDVYENVLPKHGDALFHRMMTVINQNPGQILRYCRDPMNQPLLIRDDRDSLPRKCPRCSGPMVCEVQILPTLIPSLTITANDEEMTTQESILEFGTVLVYTCLSSCDEANETGASGVKYSRETVLMQPELM